MSSEARRDLVVLALLGAGFCGALATRAGAPASTLPTSEEKTLIEKCLLPLPTKVQVAMAVVQGDSVRHLGAEKTPGGIRTIEKREAVFEIGSITKLFTTTLLAQQVVKGAVTLDQPNGPCEFRCTLMGVAHGRSRTG